MSLTNEWVERIFSRLLTIYGNKFANMWRGIDKDEIKETWGDALGGFSHRPDIIRKVLTDCLDKEWPPNLPEFLSMCRTHARRMPPAEFALPAPEIVQALENRKMKELTQSQKLTRQCRLHQ